MGVLPVVKSDLSFCAMKKTSSRTASGRHEHHTQAGDASTTGQRAFEALRAELAAIPREQLATVNVDVQVTAITALAVARAIAKDAALRARFHAIAKAARFDVAKLDGLESTALAAWYARHQFLLASAVRSNAQLPAALASTAAEVKARMLRVVEYHLGDHPVAGPVAGAIRPGTGYLDLANDLVALGRLYADYRALLAHDEKGYAAGDEALAARLGGEIIVLLGGAPTPEQETWAEHQARAWTKLQADYAEVAAVGRFLKRGDDDVATSFPSLIAASRTATPGRTSAAPAPAPGGPAAGAPALPAAPVAA